MATFRQPIDWDDPEMILAEPERQMLQNRIVLVVEDDHMMRKLIVRYVERLGGQTLEAASLAEVAEIDAPFHRVPIALIDHNLDDGPSGPEVTQWLKSMNPAMSTILVSAMETEELADKASRIGATMYCPKPIPFNLFKILIGNALEFQARSLSNQLLRESQEVTSDLIRGFIRNGDRIDHKHYDRVFTAVDERLRYAVPIDSSALLVQRHGLNWSVASAIGIGEQDWSGAGLHAGRSFLDLVADSGDVTANKPSEIEIETPFFEILNPQHTCFVRIRMPRRQYSAAVWVIARSANNGPFTEVETDLLRESRPFLESSFARLINLEQTDAMFRGFLDSLDDDPGENTDTEHWLERVAAAANADEVVARIDGVVYADPPLADDPDFFNHVHERADKLQDEISRKVDTGGSGVNISGSVTEVLTNVHRFQRDGFVLLRYYRSPPEVCIDILDRLLQLTLRRS